MITPFRFKKLCDNIYLHVYESFYDLTMSVVRIQEFYESSKFQGKFFTLEEYMDWYCEKQKTQVFTYTGAFCGFNWPGKSLLKWCHKYGYNGPESVSNPNVRKKEIQLLKPVWKLGTEEVAKSYFILGTLQDKDLYATILHEIAHALYCIEPEYKKRCMKIFNSIPSCQRKKLYGYLRRNLYSSFRYKDEIQAYLSTGGIRSLKTSYYKCQTQYRNNLNRFLSLPKYKKLIQKIEKYKNHQPQK